MSGVTVYVEEECGYRHWIWSPGLTVDELVEMWKARPDFRDAFMDPSESSLPGTWKRIVDAFSEDMVEMVDEEGKGYDLRELRKGVSAHIHVEHDTYLTLPDGTEVRHAGYTPWPDDEEPTQ